MDSCDFYTTLGKKLRARRRTKHMTLSDLSKKLNKKRCHDFQIRKRRGSHKY